MTRNLPQQLEVKSKFFWLFCSFHSICSKLSKCHIFLDRYLDISENDVKEIPKGISALIKLDHFNVKKNPKIKTLPEEMLKMEKLNVLEVEEKLLDTIDKDKRVFIKADHGVFRRIVAGKTSFIAPPSMWMTSSRAPSTNDLNSVADASTDLTTTSAAMSTPPTLLSSQPGSPSTQPSSLSTQPPSLPTHSPPSYSSVSAPLLNEGVEPLLHNGSSKKWEDKNTYLIV